MRPEVSILASLHLGFVLLSILPGEIGFVERYQRLTVTAQNWRMFYTAYTYREQEFSVVADNGVVFRAAPPRYLDREAGKIPIRVLNHLVRLRNPGNETARQVWIETLAEEVEKAGGHSYTVVDRSLRIRNFYYSRRDGVLFKEERNEMGPFLVE